MTMDSRRSERLIADLPVVVYGEINGDRSFREETFTVTINAHGALMMLEAKVALGQKLMLANSAGSDRRECRVAYTGPDRAGLAQVAVEFMHPAPEFWAIPAPPASWAEAKSS